MSADVSSNLLDRRRPTRLAEIGQHHTLLGEEAGVAGEVATVEMLA
jgi:hypothetical protein